MPRIVWSGIVGCIHVHDLILLATLMTNIEGKERVERVNKVAGVNIPFMTPSDPFEIDPVSARLALSARPPVPDPLH